MMKSLIAVLIASMVAAAAPAPEEPPSPPPVPGRARIVEAKVQVEVNVPVTVNRVEYRTTSEVVNGQVVTRTVTVNVPTTVIQTVAMPIGKDTIVTDITGARVAQDQLPDLLKERSDVLVSADGKPINSTHLRKAKAGTLVFVFPSFKVPGTPSSPQPSEKPRSSLPPSKE